MYALPLAGLNVNQLVSLRALLTEQGVGPAARTMGVTQSAMSHTLRQLRELLDDPLLVRVGNRMQPTPFAEEVQNLKVPDCGFTALAHTVKRRGRLLKSLA